MAYSFRMISGVSRLAVSAAVPTSALFLSKSSYCEGDPCDTPRGKLGALDAWFRTQVKSGCLPGAQLMVIKGGKEIYHGTEGYANVAAKVPVSGDTIFRIYSMSKPVTGALAMILAEKGVIGLDDDVGGYLSCFKREKMRVLVPGGTSDGPSAPPATEPLAAPLTIRHLMSHTSGLTYAIFGQTYSDKELAKQFTPAELQNWITDVDNARMCEAAAAPPLLFQPGSKWHYGLSSDVLGHVLERATGVSLDALMRRELFEPLGMADTDFHCPPSKQDRLAECYLSAPAFGALPVPPKRCAADKRSPSAGLHGGGGLVSTARDYAKLARFLQTGRAVTEEGGERRAGPPWPSRACGDEAKCFARRHCEQCLRQGSGKSFFF